jgi:Transposase zinc-binding domain
VAPERSATDTSPRDPQRGALHAILRRHLASFLAERERLEAPLPRFVVDELEGYLDCGRLSAGCARFECEGCGLTRVTALSCKGRGFALAAVAAA